MKPGNRDRGKRLMNEGGMPVNDNRPLVSVIIPVYKSENVIREAVSSVLSQDYRHFELLLIDDGSPDNSFAVCNELAEADSRIRVFHKENGGLCSARNFGLTKAEGKYVAFLDHDDAYLPGYLSKNIELMEKYQADVIKFEFSKKVFDEKGAFIQETHSSRIRTLPGVENGTVCYTARQIREYYPKIKGATKLLYLWDGIYSRDFVEKHRIRFEESFRYGHEDILFDLKVFHYAEKAVFHDGVYYVHNYLEQSSTSARFAPERIKNSVSCISYELDMMEKWGIGSEEQLISIADDLFIVLKLLCMSANRSSRKENYRYLAYYREHTVMRFDNPGPEIRKLMKKQKMTGLLLWELYREHFGNCIRMYQLYTSLPGR